MIKIAVLVNEKNRKRVFDAKYYDRLRRSGDLFIYDKEDFTDKEYYLDFVKGSDIIITSWA